MSFETKTDATGARWSYSIVGASRILMANAYMRALTSGAKAKLVPVGMGLPDAATVEMDHKAIKTRRDEIYGENWVKFSHELQQDGKDAFKTLCVAVAETAQLRKNRSELFTDVGGINARAGSRADQAVALATIVRDNSIMTLGIIATFASGGISYAAGAVAAGGAGAAKYQDTGDFGQAAVATTGGLLMLGWGGVAKAAQATGAAKGCLIGLGIMTDSMFEYTGAIMEKKSQKEAVLSAASKAIFGLIGQGIDGCYEADAALDETRKLVDKAGLETYCRLFYNNAGEVVRKGSVEAIVNSKHRGPAVAVAENGPASQIVRTKALHRL